MSHRIALLTVLLITFVINLSAQDNYYNRARKAYYERISKKDLKEKDYYKLIELFEESYKKDKQKILRGKAAFMVVKLAYIGYKRHKKDSLYKKLLEYNKKIQKIMVPVSLIDDCLVMVAKASYERGERDLSRLFLENIVREYPQSDQYSLAVRLLQRWFGEEKAVHKTVEIKRHTGGKDGLILLKGIKIDKNSSGFRAILYFSGRKDYVVGHIIGSNERIYVDVPDCRIGKGVKRVETYSHSLLERIRVAYNDIKKVRVVFDLKKASHFKDFWMENPSRLVIDIGPEIIEKKNEVDSVILKNIHKDVKKKVNNIEDHHKKRPIVVIDPGHGGEDPGAIGYRRVVEKKLVLDIAKRVAEMLKRDGVSVYLTRTKDVFIPLEQRTAYANSLNADLFVSIHANASKSRLSHGIETFFLDNTTDEYANKIAARENAISKKQVTELQLLLADLESTANIEYSIRLAGKIQKNLVENLKKYYSDVVDLGIKGALFYVLWGAKMPSVLIEIGFITNPKEAERFINERYRQRVAESIFSGIMEFLNGSQNITIE